MTRISQMIVIAVLLVPNLGNANVPRRLQGKWILVEVHQQDQVSKMSHENSGCTITDKELVLKAGAITQKYQLHVDLSTSPPQINTGLKTDKGVEVSPGIYNLVGDRLRVCFAVPGSPRPEGFSAHVGEPHFMWVFKRPVEKPPFTESTELTPGQKKKLREASDALQGSWKIVSMEWDGRQYPGKVSGKIVILGANATSYGGDKPVTYSLEIDPNVSPAQLNMLMKMDGEVQIKQCIYKLEGDTLTLCHHFKSNQARPSEFKTKASDGLLLTTLKRETIQQTGSENTAR